jgi:DeoR/GlpR family transcriptional regulator of sugar metabolism
VYLERGIPMNTQQRQKIVRFLHEKKVITSSELARYLGMSWNTAERYLMELALEKKITRIKKEGVNLWMA